VQALTLLFIIDDVSQQQVVVTQDDRRREARQNAVQQINFSPQLFTAQRQLLKPTTNIPRLRLPVRYPKNLVGFSE